MKKLILSIALVLCAALLFSCGAKEKSSSTATTEEHLSARIYKAKAHEAYNNRDYEAAYKYSKRAESMNVKDKITIEKAYIKEILVKEGKFYTAAEMIGNSAMSEEEKNELFAEYNDLALCRAGQIAKFAKYETDGNVQNGPEDVEWIVLRVEQAGGGKAYATLLSKDVIGQPGGWNKVDGNTSYAQSNLHDWCETVFYNELIRNMDEEQTEKMVMVHVTTGKDTVEAYVYAPSKAEIEKCLTENLEKHKKASATKAAKADGVTESDGGAAYYLREVGKMKGKVSGYNEDGEYEDGFSATSFAIGARVCITVCLGEY